MATQEAVFIGANKQNHVADSHPQTHAIAFGAGTTIALWNPLNDQGVYQTLKSHTKEVTGVRFIPSTDFIVSISEDFTIKMWKFNYSSYDLYQTLALHDQSITCLSVANEKLFVAGSADGNISIVTFNDTSSQFELSHQFQVKVGFYPLSIDLINVEKNNYVMAIGGTSVALFIYSFTLSDSVQDFKLTATLAGHEDWIKCLKFRKQSDDWVLASGSQDRYIRLWRLKINNQIDNSDEDSSKLILLSNKQYKFAIDTTKCAFNFEALIMGHDDWITSVNWHPDPNIHQLISSSADTALMIWEMDANSGIWCVVSRLGELSNKGASTATGSSGGFWSSVWFENNDSQYILTNGKTGAFRVYVSTDKGASWDRQLGVTGPTKECTDLSWSKNGDYLLATSLDQTTRLYAKWTKNYDGTEKVGSWHEFARPQIHGYDMICVSCISDTQFISGGDEKLLRSFNEPKSVANLLSKFCDIEKQQHGHMPDSASLPVLGLSNKAGDDSNEESTIQDDELKSLVVPPFEDHLQRQTLFPEIEKLYGHGYEITCVSTSPDSQLVASACRSNTLQHSTIRIFDTTTWLELKPALSGHNLTVTNLSFSRDNKYLLAVSRDRQFSLWNIADKKFTLVKLYEKAHTKIIWDCCWGPQQNGTVFFTGSRDKRVNMWRIAGGNVELVNALKVTDAVTSIDVFHDSIQNSSLLAIGKERGSIGIYLVNESGFKLVHQVSEIDTPAGRIQKLSWSNRVAHDKLLLGVVSYDNSTRIYSFAKEFLK